MGIGVFSKPGAVVAVGVLLAAAAASTVTVLRSPTGGFPGQPAEPDGTVVVYGRGGSFGVGEDVLPSGQSVDYRLVPGWEVPPGAMAAKTVVTADGTILWGSRTLDLDVDLPTSAVLAFGAYRPDTNRHTVVRARTSTGRDEVRDAAGRPAAPSVSGLELLDGGRSVVFTAGTGVYGQDFAAAGAWPVLGVLTTVDGRWRVTRQWTGRDLRDAGGAPGAAACPPRSAAVVESDCRQFGDVAVLPTSGEIIATQQYGTGPDVPGPPPMGQVGVTAWLGTTPGGNGGMAAIRLDGDTATVRAQLTYPEVRVPGLLGGAPVRVIPENVTADPTSAAGDERFVVTFKLDVPVGVHVPRFLQEFSYDAGTGAIRPASAPFIPGDRVGFEPNGFLGFSATLYDRHGNLWAARADPMIGAGGGRLAVYTRENGRQRCADTGSNVSAAGAAVAWGRVCAPDYDLLPAASTLTSHGLAEDPATGAIVSLHWGGHVQAYLPSGRGADMTFQVANALDLGRKLMIQREDDMAVGWLAGFDGSGRVWSTASVLRSGAKDARTDQFLYSFGLDDLRDPAPVDLPTAAGRSIVVQAERTFTTATRTKRVGETVEVSAVATTGTCSDLWTLDGCGYDRVRGDGYILRDPTGYGVPEGTVVDYQVRVAETGTYRLSFHVGSFAGTKARILVEVAGQSSNTSVQTDGPWLTVEAAKPLILPAGTHTLRLVAPRDGGGWFLNHLVFQRV
jgi:hypothetical protein